MDYQAFFHQLLQLSRAVVNNLNKKMADYDLNHSQMIVIYYLKDVGTSTLVDIASYLHVEKSSVTRTVHRLEKSGFIEQVPGKDKRERKIKLSDWGEEIYAISSKITKQFDRSAMNGVSDEELEATFQVLHKIMNNVNESGGKKGE